MDKMLVVLEHALELQWKGGSGWKHLSYFTREVPGETGSLGQRQIKEKACCARRLSWFRKR